MSKVIKNEYLSSFVISVLIITAGFAFMGLYPFGEYSFTCSDMQAQFLDLTAGLFDNIKSGKSIFVSWGGGMGVNLYAWSTYLLFSPLNILFLFFDSVHYQEVYMLIVILKFGFISLFTSLYLKNSRYTNLKGKLNVAFAVLYAFGVFNLRSVINVMWLDNVALLPVVLLGIERVIEKRKAELLFFSFLICMVSNFYLAYMTGIFSFLYFIFYYVCCAEEKNVRHIIASIFLCGIAVLLVAGISAVILIPNWVTISNTYEDLFADTSDKGIWSWQLINLMQCLFMVQEKSAIAETLHGFFGIVPIFFGLIFLLNASIPKKERIAAFLWMFFMLFSLVFRPFYLMWHIFRDPVCFYGRFVYTVAFLFIMLSARCTKNISFRTGKFIIIPIVAIFAGGFYALSEDTTFWLIGNFIIVITFAAAYGIIVYLYTKTAKNISLNIMTILIICEAGILCFTGLKAAKSADSWTPRITYIEYMTNSKGLLSEIEPTDDFYRADDVNAYSMNSGIGSGYNSISVFSSFTNQKSLGVLNQLGLAIPYDYRISANYTNGIVTDGFLNNKYILATKRNTAGFVISDSADRKIHTVGGKSIGYRLTSDNYEKVVDNEYGELYLNKTAFPTMFSVNDDVINIHEQFLDKNFYITGSFRNQAKFLNSCFGTEYKLYTELEFEEPETKHAEIKNVTGKYDFFDLELTNLKDEAVLANEGDEVGIIEYKYTVDEPGEYYIDSRIKFDAELDTVDHHMTCINGVFAMGRHGAQYQLDTPDIGHYNEGDEIEVQILAMRNLYMMKPVLLRLNMDEFEDIYNRANENALKDIKQVNNDITAVSDFDEERLIFSSISYDSGFHVFIDGEETETIEIANCFLGYRVPAGKHNILIKYVSPGFVTGRNISIISLIITIIALVFNKKIKYEKPVFEENMPEETEDTEDTKDTEDTEEAEPLTS